MDSYTAVRLGGSPKPTDVTVDGPTLEGTRRATHERGSANGEEVGQEAGEEVAVERERKKGGDSAESAEPCISDLGCSRRNLASFYDMAHGDPSR